MKSIKFLAKITTIIIMLVCEIYLVVGKNITEIMAIWIFVVVLIYDMYNTFILNNCNSRKHKMASAIGIFMCLGGMFIIEKEAVVFIFILKQLFDIAKNNVNNK